MLRRNLLISVSIIAVLTSIIGCAPRNGVFIIDAGKLIKEEEAADTGLYGTPPEGLTDEQREALNAVNYYRAAAGVPAAIMAQELNEAAQSHAEYVASYGITGMDAHLEEEDREGFTGERVWERTEHFGFTTGRIAEDISFRKTAEDAVANLMATVYHRFALLWPGAMAIGYGHSINDDMVMEYFVETYYGDYEAIEGIAAEVREGHVHVLDFAQYDVIDISDGRENSSAIVFPRPGSANVPRQMRGEVPDPAPKEPTPYGYPVTLQFYSLHKDVVFLDGKLFDYDGNEMDCWVLTPESDPHGYLEKEMCILPKEPLPAKSYFRAEFYVEIDGAGKIIETFFATK
ncbi:MAG: CAP domain-containing protein [bacterium]|nr:CAP domain-containing protein [bacterium]